MIRNEKEGLKLKRLIGSSFKGKGISGFKVDVSSQFLFLFLVDWI